jgi:hypothetical protein
LNKEGIPGGSVRSELGAGSFNLKIKDIVGKILPVTSVIKQAGMLSEAPICSDSVCPYAIFNHDLNMDPAVSVRKNAHIVCSQRQVDTYRGYIKGIRSRQASREHGNAIGKSIVGTASDSGASCAL